MASLPLAAPPPSSLSGDPLLKFLAAVMLLLLLAHVLGRLAALVHLPAVVGELATGVVLGPSLLGHVAPGATNWLFFGSAEQMHLLDGVGQIGIVLLVGLTGTHLDVGMLRRRKGTAARISLCGLITPLALGVTLGALQLPSLTGANGSSHLVFSAFLGIAMCVSAIPVIAKTLSDMRLLHREVGQLALASGTIDDAVGWFLLSVVSMAATSGVSTGHVLRAVGYLVGFIAVAALVARPLVRQAMRFADRREEPGPSTVTAVGVIMLGAVATQALGMEPVFGAFVAGIVVGLPGAANQAKLAALRSVVLSVLAPIFLATAGLRTDLTALTDPHVALAAVLVLVVAVVGKFSGAYAGARLSRLSQWEGLAIGAGMNARGVVEVVIALTGLRLGVLNTATYTIIVLVAICTSLMAPPILRYATARIEHSEEENLRMAQHDSWDGGVGSAQPQVRSQTS